MKKRQTKEENFLELNTAKRHKYFYKTKTKWHSQMI